VGRCRITTIPKIMGTSASPPFEYYLLFMLSLFAATHCLAGWGMGYPLVIDLGGFENLRGLGGELGTLRELLDPNPSPCRVVLSHSSQTITTIFTINVTDLSEIMQPA
jgi:hypothetical protein